ncbi:MAG: type VI secretion system-associated FHA domain protein TagH [Candidatus Contendobacter sp.]
MPLKLTITSFQRLSPGQESTRILEHGSLMIGRAAQNDWILQDPERILSSNHCAIHCKGGGYFLTDTSTNGTFVNDSEQRIPRNQTVQLQDGDHFVLGEYEIEVNVVAEGEAFPQTDSGSITDIVPLPGVADSAQHSLLDLKRHLKRPQPIQGAALTEPSPDQLMPERAAFEPPELIRQSPSPAAPVVDFSPPPPPAVAEPSTVRETPPVADDAGVDASLAAIPDLAAPSAAEAGAIIPEDWWLGPGDAPSVAPPVAPQPVPPSPPPPAAIPVPSAPAVAPLATPARPSAEEAQPVLATPTATLSAAPDATALFHAFLEGAGLARPLPTPEEQLEIMANLGAIFRQTVQGLTDILLARGDVKGEFRLDRTTMGPVENNPLKTPPGRPPLSLETAMNLLLIRQRDAYMSPVQAVHESFNDIKAHQMAVMAGIQAALNRLLERFNPSNLETRLEQTVLDSILPASRKAKYWDLFTAEYQAIAREAEDDFNELFGHEFARAYEQQLRTRS